MDSYQKQQITAFRASGETCAKIAETLDLSVNTVKSFCRRYNLKTNAETKMEAETGTGSNTAAETKTNCAVCPQCGNKITQTGGRKPKRFCSDECRVKWWNSHLENVKQKAVYTFKCVCCGKDFTAYGKAKRRYCSHSCYCKDRFGDTNTLSGRAEKGIRGEGAAV